jgi:glycyl-tRNA synthetase beta chain
VAEQGLLAALERATADSAPLWEKKAYAELLPALLALEEPIHTFFENVMVNVDDPALRGNRLRLLADVRDLFVRGWDLSRIVVEGEKG